jgi:hypothetical protein
MKFGAYPSADYSCVLVEAFIHVLPVTEVSGEGHDSPQRSKFAVEAV